MWFYEWFGKVDSRKIRFEYGFKDSTNGGDILAIQPMYHTSNYPSSSIAAVIEVKDTNYANAVVFCYFGGIQRVYYFPKSTSNFPLSLKNEHYSWIYRENKDDPGM